jgi:ribosomal protein S12 methylthiotransferase
MAPYQKGKRVCLISLGCKKNLVDSEVLLGSLIQAGFVITEREEDAEVLIVNTCGFIEDAKEESIETILDLARYKDNGCCKALVVTGCLVQRYPSELPASLPEVDHFFGTEDSSRVAEVLEGAEALEATSRLYHSHPDCPKPRLHTGPAYSAWVKIAEGCSNRCAYCVIPSIRGPLSSRSVHSIQEEVESFVERGAVEINLVAQDVAAFGLDRSSKERLPELLQCLRTIDELKWLRLLYCHPRHVTEEMLEIIADGAPLCRYLDIPIQHIDDKILALMNRKITEEEIRSLLERIRKAIPGIHLRTTLLVGFPGETEERFQRLLDFVRAFEFESLGCFKYSREEGSPAYEMEGQVPEELKQERLDRVMKCQLAISRKKNRGLVGTVQEVLIDGVSEECELILRGRTEFQAPEIDGWVYITRGTATAGEIVRARIVESHDYDLSAEILL